MENTEEGRLPGPKPAQFREEVAEIRRSPSDDFYIDRSKTCLLRSCHAEEEEQAPLGVRGISTEYIFSSKETR